MTMNDTTLLCLDIETTGLDFTADRILTVALALSTGTSGCLDHPDDEAELLRMLEAQVSEFLASIPGEHAIVTWNGSAFDLPFLAARFEAHGIPTTLNIEATDKPGKYRSVRFEGTWGTASTVDIAYGAYQAWAERTGTKWSLKPVAQALLGVTGTPVDVTGPNGALDLDPDIRSQYCREDAEMVLGLSVLPPFDRWMRGELAGITADRLTA